MEQPQQQEQEQRFKTLGVRIEEGLHAQLTFIAQLSERTITDEIRHAIEARVSSAQSDPDLVARAEAKRAEIAREAMAREQALAGFFGRTAVKATADDAKPRGRGRTPNTPS